MHCYEHAPKFEMLCSLWVSTFALSPRTRIYPHDLPFPLDRHIAHLSIPSL
uniref:Uncharacterized protein n=1 Tax=Picea glauca TaxID=3330 RepID=A0A101LYP6_PICGL|nr:hypothetical protein ABT39_MTgene4813 [Picea glauca]